MSNTLVRLMGSIPACAGETYGVEYSGTADGVHPRVCGGNGNLYEAHMNQMGPSPRVRGKHARM